MYDDVWGIDGGYGYIMYLLPSSKGGFSVRPFD